MSQTTRTEEDYSDLAEDERVRRIKRATEESYKSGYREQAKRRTQSRRFARRTKREERGA